MKERPPVLSFLSLAFFTMGVSFPLQILISEGHWGSDWIMIFNKLTFMNWILMGCYFLISWLCLSARSFLLILFPASLFATIMNNYWVGLYSTHTTLGITNLASLFYFFISFLFLEAHALEALLNSSSRWWLTPKRWKLIVPLLIKEEQKIICVRSFDFSRTGVFIKASDQLNIKKFQIGQSLSLELKLLGKLRITCLGEVVRLNQAPSSYPPGLGLRLTFQHPWQKLNFYRQFYQSVWYHAL